MYNECLNKLPDNVYINPTIITKRVHHGSLTHGMYSNMCYALEHFQFEYFLVCSSRNFMENNLTIDKLNNLKYVARHPFDANSYNVWWWPLFSHSLIFKYFYSRNESLYHTPHEGVLFKYNDVANIKDFLESNVEVRDNLFQFEGCVEEFSLQSIAVNTGGGCMDLGNGCLAEHRNGPSDTKFCYKVKRE